MQQHAADLVAAEQMPLSLSVLYGHTQTVAVRIGGENHIGIHLGSKPECKFIGARIFRIRHFDRAEIRIRHLLFFHHSHIGQADLLQQPPYGYVSASMQRSIHNVEF